jgi:anti-sigma factor ChrR (cupin superfamily)
LENPEQKKPQDVDDQLRADSRRLLAEMEGLIGRARLLLLEQGGGSSSGTLGDVLYADRTKPRLPEKDWLALVDAIAGGDRDGLHRLYERTHGVVFTLISRLVGDVETAALLTLDVYQDAWREAPGFDRRNGTVLAWIMNLAQRRAREGRAGEPSVDLDTSYSSGWAEPAWEEVAPGISVKMLATDAERSLVSMLVRLVPGGEYPAHTHAGVEELHLLEGELWIDERKLYPGAYNRAEPGTGDKRVWSETGCMCVLVTSTKDILR